jgi:hypothetical protein
VITFYPRWFTYNQGSNEPCNQLVGPDTISPAYHAVVAINDDTLYASTFIGVKQQPVIVTVPATSDNYSVLQLDGFGAIFSGIPSNQPGVYGLTAPGWSGTLPTGVVQVQMPYDYTELIFRADRYNKSGNTYVNVDPEATQFRAGLHAAYLSDYLSDPNSGAANILSEAFFTVPYKQTADNLVALDAISFLTQLQTAVHAGTTQPLTPNEQAVSDAFDALFGDSSLNPQFIAGAQDGHKALDANYLTHVLSGSTWITFPNMGTWTDDLVGYLDRSSIMEYIQFGNNHTEAAYFQTFLDGKGHPLDGSQCGYILTFPQGQQPSTTRFWSVTAYLPESIELIPNASDTYLVGAYSPGLVTSSNGSVSIYMFVNKPANVPTANWLPVPNGPFNIMLRDYGPTGSVLDNTYTPPAVSSICRMAR